MLGLFLLLLVCSFAGCFGLFVLHVFLQGAFSPFSLGPWSSIFLCMWIAGRDHRAK